MRHTLIPIILLSSAAFAQPPVAPTTEPTESTRGMNMSEYNILNSFELGYRFATIGGNSDMYRSTVNYTNGIRLLSSSLLIQSKDGRGKWFDQIVLNTMGLGNDPYQTATLRIEKNGLYRYDLGFREIAYVNPALTISGGEHAMNTSHRFQDHDLTLFPQGRFKLFLGYSRIVEDGPALTTVQEFDAKGDEFPLFANLHRQTNEYRLGGEVRVLGVRLNVMRGWEDFKDDSPVSLTSPSQGNNPGDLNTLTSLTRPEPQHGTSPYWRVGLFREGKKLWAVNGRFTYVAGRNAFVQDELAVGTSRFGAAMTQEILQMGDGRRPALTGNLTFTLFPVENITVTNQTSISNIRMIGNSVFEQTTNAGAPIVAFPFALLGVRGIGNVTSVEVRIKPWIAIHTGYDYDDRRVQSIEGTDFGPTPAPRVLNQQTNILQDGTIGVRLRPLKPLTINLDGEVGRANRPIFPISDGNYTALNGRVAWKERRYRLGVYARSNYNTNSISITSFASHSRQYGADASWNGKEWFSIDASYTKLHLDTLGGVDFFLSPGQQFGSYSYYVSNIHTGNLAAHFTLFKRADILLGFSRVQDTGDGRVSPIAAGNLAALNPLPGFQAAQTFPLQFTSPLARISIRMSQQLRWNAGYQYYGYREDFSTLQNYRAQTGYSSLSWSF